MELIPIRGDSGAAAVDSLFSGEADVAFMGLVPLLKARSFGLDVRILGIVNRCGDSHGVVLAKGADGKQRPVIATVKGSTAHYVAWEWSREESVVPYYLHLQPEAGLQALRDGAVDGLSTWEPTFFEARSAVAVPAFTSKSIKTEVLNCLAVTGEAVRTKRALIRGFLDAYNRAVEILKSDLERGRAGQIINMVYPAAQVEGLGNRYDWVDVRPPKRQSRSTKFRNTLERAERFLEAEGLLGPSTDGLLSNIVVTSGEIEVNGAGHEGIAEKMKIAYSPSMMCAPLHIANAKGIFADVGLQLRRDLLKGVERTVTLGFDKRAQLERILRDSENDYCDAVGGALKLVDKELLGYLVRILDGLEFDHPGGIEGMLRDLDRAGVLVCYAEYTNLLANAQMVAQGIRMDNERCLRSLGDAEQILVWLENSHGEDRDQEAIIAWSEYYCAQIDYFVREIRGHKSNGNEDNLNACLGNVDAMSCPYDPSGVILPGLVALELDGWLEDLVSTEPGELRDAIDGRAAHIESLLATQT